MYKQNEGLNIKILITYWCALILYSMKWPIWLKYSSSLHIWRCSKSLFFYLQIISNKYAPLFNLILYFLKKKKILFHINNVISWKVKVSGHLTNLLQRYLTCSFNKHVFIPRRLNLYKNELENIDEFINM